MRIHQTYEHLTVPRIRVMGLLSSGKTIAQVADELGITYDGAKSHIRDIKGITGCETVDEVRAWWGSICALGSAGLRAALA